MNKMVDACVLVRTRAFTMKLVISFTNYLAAPGEVDPLSQQFYSAPLLLPSSAPGPIGTNEYIL